jgi:alpha-tubulin suppressor-like RCC1 family protein
MKKVIAQLLFFLFIFISLAGCSEEKHSSLTQISLETSNIDTKIHIASTATLTFTNTPTQTNLPTSTLLPNIKSLSVGATHTCALLINGGVKCWGENSLGELGDGTKVSRSIPESVVGLDSGVIAIKAGYHFSCAITENEGVKCWGQDAYGSLGNGILDKSSTVPVDVMGLRKDVVAIDVASFGYSACAVLKEGSVKCWGYNFHGLLGIGTSMDTAVPSIVQGLKNEYADVAIGRDHICVLSKNGSVKCWGKNYFGELGDGTTINRMSPVEVMGLINNVKKIDAGFQYSCILAFTGRVKCWGTNEHGVLGIGYSDTYSSTPVDVDRLESGILDISIGVNHSCVLTSLGGVKCWGYNSHLQLGDGTSLTRELPIDVIGLSNRVQLISAGAFHTCAMTSDGKVFCWGNNEYGQLGNESNNESAKPVEVENST